MTERELHDNIDRLAGVFKVIISQLYAGLSPEQIGGRYGRLLHANYGRQSENPQEVDAVRVMEGVIPAMNALVSHPGFAKIADAILHGEGN